MAAPQIAIGYGDQPYRVSLWCDGLRRYPSGTIAFHVINGLWNGSITPEGELKVDRTGSIFPGPKVLWEGKAPHSDYNDAIAWIEEQLRQPAS